jgi:hypothetical protein
VLSQAACSVLRKLNQSCQSLPIHIHTHACARTHTHANTQAFGGPSTFVRTYVSNENTDCTAFHHAQDLQESGSDRATWCLQQCPASPRAIPHLTTPHLTTPHLTTPLPSFSRKPETARWSTPVSPMTILSPSSLPAKRKSTLEPGITCGVKQPFQAWEYTLSCFLAYRARYAAQYKRSCPAFAAAASPALTIAISSGHH